MSWTTLAPRSRNGVSGDQKGPRIAEEVAETPSAVTTVWLISSTRLDMLLAIFKFYILFSKWLIMLFAKGTCERLCPKQKKWYSRLDTQDITHSPSLISVFPVVYSYRVDVVDAQNPFVLCELDLSAKIVDMADQRAENFPVSWLGFRTHEINHMLGKVGVEFGIVVFGSCPTCCAIGVAIGGAVGTVGSHDVVVFSLVVEGIRRYIQRSIGYSSKITSMSCLC